MRKTRKRQKTIVMVGCSRCKGKRSCKSFLHKGGSGCGSCGCPIAPYKMSGGKMPGPFVGEPWSPNNLPGQDGIGSNRNYLSPYDTTKDPSYQMSMNDSGYLTKSSFVGGGKRRKYKTRQKKSRRKLKHKGGGLMPQDLLNLGRDFTYNFKSAYNSLNGYSAPVNPAPYKDQLTYGRVL